MLNTYESLSLVQPPIEVINTISEGSNAEIIELLEPVDFDSIINKIKHELYKRVWDINPREIASK